MHVSFSFTAVMQIACSLKRQDNVRDCISKPAIQCNCVISSGCAEGFDSINLQQTIDKGDWKDENHIPGHLDKPLTFAEFESFC